MKNMTFKDIEKNEFINKPDNDSPLQRWYNQVREKKISEFSIEDICKAVRQNIYIKYVMPEVVTRLEENVSAGELYDGELVSALANIPKKEWNQIPTERSEIHNILIKARNTVDSNIKKEIDSLLQIISK